MYKINEIFSAIQGEGLDLGIPSTFIRFSGCDLNCKFCDTHHDPVNGNFTLSELFGLVKELGNRSVIITGGEPTLHPLLPLLKLLKEDGIRIGVESNFYMPTPEGWEDFVDTWSLAPKAKVTLEVFPKWQAFGISVPDGTQKAVKLLHPHFSRLEIEYFLEKFQGIDFNYGFTFYIMPVNQDFTLHKTNNENSLVMAKELAREFPDLDIRWGTQWHKTIGEK